VKKKKNKRTDWGVVREKYVYGGERYVQNWEKYLQKTYLIKDCYPKYKINHKNDNEKPN
jgi:hypothetical protein